MLVMGKAIEMQVNDRVWTEPRVWPLMSLINVSLNVKKCYLDTFSSLAKCSFLQHHSGCKRVLIHHQVAYFLSVSCQWTGFIQVSSQTLLKNQTRTILALFNVLLPPS